MPLSDLRRGRHAAALSGISRLGAARIPPSLARPLARCKRKSFTLALRPSTVSTWIAERTDRYELIVMPLRIDDLIYSENFFSRDSAAPLRSSHSRDWSDRTGCQQRQTSSRLSEARRPKNECSSVIGPSKALILPPRPRGGRCGPEPSRESIAVHDTDTFRSADDAACGILCQRFPNLRKSGLIETENLRSQNPRRLVHVARLAQR